MEYIGDKEYWDEKFSNRSYNLLKSEKSLVDSIDYLKKGTVLDIACGDGRNSIFLLEKGFRVTGVDFSVEALKRLNIFAERKKYVINTIQPSDFQYVEKSFELVKYVENEDERGFFVTYIFRKNGSDISETLEGLL